MQLFLDTNIYLDYFRSSDRGMLTPLRRLDEMVRGGEVTLIVPEQLVNEYTHRRRSVIEEARDKIIAEQKINLTGYRFLGATKTEVKTIERSKKSIKKSYDNLIEKLDKRADDESFQADKIIKKLFKNGFLPDESSEILDKAHKRYLRGNPPRKNNHSYGDAILWELLLSEARNDDLIIVSNDSDFTEKQKGVKKLNNFLKEEWEKKTGKDIEFFSNLAECVNYIDKEDPIDEEIVESEKKRAEIDEFDSWGNILVSDNFMVHDITKTPNETITDIMGPTTTINSWGQSEIIRCAFCGHQNLKSHSIFGDQICRNCGNNLSHSSIF